MGLIITEVVTVEPTYTYLPGDMCCYDDTFIPGWEKLASAVHEHGAKILPQLFHPAYMAFNVPGTPRLIAPSFVGPSYAREAPRPITIDEIHELTHQFGDAAVRMQKAGIDGVEVHAAHAHGMLGGFLSPQYNKRTDEYGGSLENRARFLQETLRAVRAACGENFPVILGVNMDDLLPEGVSPCPGITVDEQIAVCRLLEDEGLVDAYQLRIGNYYDQESIVPSAYHDNTPYRENFARFKAGVQQPCIFENRLDDPAEMQRMLEAGEADFFSLGRMWIANPDLVERWLHGEMPRQCLRCNYCLHALWLGKQTKCAINPVFGHEYEGEVTRAVRSKRVVVAGGGPGGVMAALTAAERGHEVTLIEREQQVGGKLGIVAAPSYKRQYLAYQDYLRGELAASEVTVRAGEEATVATVSALDPDVVIVATGAAPIIPRVPGVAEALAAGHAVVADDVLSGAFEVSGTVAIIGGGLVGAETASVLADAGCTVHLVEMQPDVLVDASYVTRHAQLRTLAETGARVHTSTRLTGIAENGIEVEYKGAHEHIACDYVVLAVGYRAISTLAEDLRPLVREVYEIGDCRQTRKIAAAVEEGYAIARRL